MVLLVIVAFLSLVGRLVFLQLIEGDVHRANARRNIVRERQLATTRGVIRDGYGRVLAANRPSYNLYVTPGQIDYDKIWPLLVKLIRLDDAERLSLETKVKERRALPEKDPGRMRQLLIKVDVDRDAVALLETSTCTSFRASRSRLRPFATIRTASSARTSSATCAKSIATNSPGSQSAAIARAIAPARSASSGAGRVISAGSAGCARCSAAG